MSEAIVVTDSVRVPGRALTVRAVRASGPGGQNVNKVATKIDLRVNLDAIEGLPEGAAPRLRTHGRPAPGCRRPPGGDESGRAHAGRQPRRRARQGAAAGTRGAGAAAREDSHPHDRAAPSSAASTSSDVEGR
jgi:hypothetical protein